MIPAKKRPSENQPNLTNAKVRRTTQGDDNRCVDAQGYPVYSPSQAWFKLSWQERFLRDFPDSPVIYAGDMDYKTIYEDCLNRYCDSSAIKTLFLAEEDSFSSLNPETRDSIIKFAFANIKNCFFDKEKIVSNAQILRLIRNRLPQSLCNQLFQRIIDHQRSPLVMFYIAMVCNQFIDKQQVMYLNVDVEENNFLYSRFPLLHFAIFLNDVHLVNSIFHSALNIRQCTEHVLSEPLFMAVSVRNIDIVNLLLNHPHMVINNTSAKALDASETLLNLAIKRHDFSAGVKALLARGVSANLSMGNPDDDTSAVEMAVRCLAYESLSVLINEKARIPDTIFNYVQMGPVDGDLPVCNSVDPIKKIIIPLIQAGENIDKGLHCACNYGISYIENTLYIRALIELGANVNVLNEDDYTALELLLSQSEKEYLMPALKCLLMAGADVNKNHSNEFDDVTIDNLLAAGYYYNPVYCLWLQPAIESRGQENQERRQKECSLTALAAYTVIDNYNFDYYNKLVAQIRVSPIPEERLPERMPIGYTLSGACYLSEALNGDKLALDRLNSHSSEQLSIWFIGMNQYDNKPFMRLSAMLVTHRFNKTAKNSLVISSAEETALVNSEHAAFATLLKRYDAKQLEQWLKAMINTPENFYYHDYYRQILSNFNNFKLQQRVEELESLLAIKPQSSERNKSTTQPKITAFFSLVRDSNSQAPVDQLKPEVTG